MAKANKAHTAAVNRIAQRYGGIVNADPNSPDIVCAQMTIEVATHASLQRGIRMLRLHDGPIYLAVTNMEAVQDALRVTQNTPIGVMDPQGNIIREYGSPQRK